MSARTVSLPDGGAMPVLGQGTYRLGESADRQAEIAALQLGVDLGLTLIDTAEIYGDGASERLVGEALSHRRDELFLVSKVCPENAGRDRLAAHCEATLRRLGTDRLDLYLIHWRGGPALAEQAEGMEALNARGLVRRWGVSNFDVAEMEALGALGANCATNQIYYNLEVRGPEFDLAPWMAARGQPVMAYSPVGQGRLLHSPALAQIARPLEVTPAQLAIAWLLTRPGFVTIPKAASIGHVRANAAAAELTLSPETLAALDAAFPPPTAKTPLELI